MNSHVRMTLFALCCAVAMPTVAHGETECDAAWQAAAEYSGAYEAAYRACLPLAEQGDAWAQLSLGYFHHQGRGVAKNGELAAHWYRNAAEQGGVSAGVAQHELGVIFSSGETVSLACLWDHGGDRCEQSGSGKFSLSCMLGLKRNSGAKRCMTSVQDVPKDRVEAYKWFSLAGESEWFSMHPAGGLGHRTLRKNIDRLEQRMSSKQIAEAQRRASQWSPRRKLF